MNHAWTYPLLLCSSITILLSILSGCLEKTQVITPIELPTTNPAPEIGKIDEKNFFVLPIFEFPETPHYMHEQTDFDTKCQVSKSESDLTKKDLYCILDVQELDLYHSKLKLNFNAPQNVCSWIRIRPYWFYDFEPSPGKIKRYMTVTKTAAGSTASDVTDETGTAVTDATVNFEKTGVNCKYDYSKDNQHPNCCEGTLYLTTIDEVTSPAPPPVTTEIDLGGKVKNCAAGPGVDYKVNTAGFPIVKDFYAENGINSTVDLQTPDDSGKNRSGILYLANFFRPDDYENADPIFSTSTTLTYPRGITGPDALLPNFPQGFPYYEFNCRDRADDVIARIRLLIRAWDTLADFENKNPYVPATSGTEPQFGETWHDRTNWTDVNPDKTSDSYPNGQ